ncbi:MAG: DMT family transporter [Actinomycetota bacterium]|nr:DMT family transporter [Actinomycetota bacterium]
MVDLASRSRAMPVEQRAIAAILVAVGLWSGTALFVRAGHSDALVFTTWRLWFALPPLAAIVSWRSRRSDSAPFWPQDVSRLRWIVLLVGAGAFFVSGAGTAFAALGLTRLLDVTLIGSLQPVLIIGFAVAFLGEHVARTHLVRAGVAIAGTIMVAVAASSGGSWSFSGDVVAVVSLVLNAGWFLYGRVLRTSFVVDPFAFMLGTLTSAAVLITPVALIAHGGLGISARGLFFAVCTMIGGTAAHVLMIWAHRHVPTSVSSPMLLGETPIVAAGAWVFFGESVTLLEGAGAAVVVASLWGVTRGPELEHVEHDVPDPAPPT